MGLLAWRHFAAGCTVFFSLVGGSREDDHAISDLINKIQNYCSGQEDGVRLRDNKKAVNYLVDYLR